MKYPFRQKKINENTMLRVFSKRVNSNKLVWHRDRERRTIIVMEGTGWKFQRDNCLPVVIQEGDQISVSAGEYHRLIKGDSDLIVTIIKEKKIHITKIEAEEFYKVHQTKPFYNDLCEYLSSGPIFVMILEKFNAILDNRELMGATDPKKADEGTIRKKYGVSIDKNSVHGSDSSENAKKEIQFFFKD